MHRLLTAAAAALVIVGPAHAGERHGGHGGGSHPGPAPCCAPPAPPPGPCCGHPGGGNTNVNVNVSARASASASAYGSAHSWSGGTIRGGSGGGTIYVGGGGYPVGDAYAVGLPVYGVSGYGLDVSGHAGPSRPFGYVVRGFGRDYRTVSEGSMSDGRRVEESRYGARYEREAYRGSSYGQSSYAESAYAESTYEESTYEAHYESDVSYPGLEADRDARPYDCGCDPAGPPPRAYEPLSGPGYYGDLPPPGNVPPVAPPPHHNYRQEPGERG